MSESPTLYYETIIKAANNALSHRDCMAWNDIGPEFAKLAKELAEERIKIFESLEKVETSLEKMGDAFNKVYKTLSED